MHHGGVFQLLAAVQGVDQPVNRCNREWRKIPARPRIIQHQRRHPAQRIVLANTVEILADGPVGMFERQPQQFHADGNATYERRVKHTYEQHEVLLHTPAKLAA